MLEVAELPQGQQVQVLDQTILFLLVTQAEAQVLMPVLMALPVLKQKTLKGRLKPWQYRQELRQSRAVSFQACAQGQPVSASSRHGQA